MGLPTLLFVNKVDRMGARHESLLADIRSKLAPHIVPMSTVTDPGTPMARTTARSLTGRDVRARVAETLAENDDALLARLIDGSLPTEEQVEALLAQQTAAGLVHPVFFGSALTGEGTKELTAGIRTFLQPPAADQEAQACGTVFAIERTEGGEKVAYLRLFSGHVRERQRVTFHRRESSGAAGEFSGRITGLDVISAPRPGKGRPVGDRRLAAGSIARVRGLTGIRVGDHLGEVNQPAGQLRFSPPSLESVVRPQHPGQGPRLFAALTSLADEDPLIRTRPAGGGATSVLLYGAVQQEVIAERLLRDFDVKAVFEPITPVYFERPTGVGEALTEVDRQGHHDFWATIGLRVAPAAPGSGVAFTRDVEWGALPRAFHRAIEESALRALEQGLYGWEVADCTITLIRVGYQAPLSTAADFRNLTPLVLMRALKAAGTRVYEPCQSVEIEAPADALSAVVGLLTTLGADIAQPMQSGASWLVTAEMPPRVVQKLTAALPGVTHGEGVLWSRPGSDRPVRGTFPFRERFDGNPLNHDEYLRFLADRSLARTTTAAVTGRH
jgi:ribosomal protection tetracycline resistance protein